VNPQKPPRLRVDLALSIARKDGERLSEKRVSWIDLTKAAALLIVIFVHSTSKDTLSGILTGFVLPVFFLLYGVTHNYERYRKDLKGYLISRFRALMIPYLVLTTAMVLLYWIVYPQVDVGLSFQEFAFWSIYGNGPPGRVSHLWFLRTMFFAIVVFSVIDRYLHDRSPVFRYFLIVVSPVIGLLPNIILGIALTPWSFDSIFIALSFMLMGHEIRRIRHTRSWRTGPLFDGAVGFTALVGVIVLGWFNGYVNIGESIYGRSVYIYLVTGVLGTYVVGLISDYVCKRIDRLSRMAASFNAYGQEIYEIHPLIIETSKQLFGGLAIWTVLGVYPGAPLFLLNFPLAIILSWLLASKVIPRSGALQFAFRGWRSRPKTREPSFSVPDQNGSDDEIPVVSQESPSQEGPHSTD
jgi:fucose 4-O-acetylase-like acetyltransferase